MENPAHFRVEINTHSSLDGKTPDQAHFNRISPVPAAA